MQDRDPAIAGAVPTIALTALTCVVSVAGLISPAVALIAVADIYGPALAVGTLIGAVAARSYR